MPCESRARGAFPVAVLQLPTYLSQELSASALPMSQPLSLIRDSGPEPIQLMCTHNAPRIHPSLHPFTPSPCGPRKPFLSPFLKQQHFTGTRVKRTLVLRLQEWFSGNTKDQIGGMAWQKAAITRCTIWAENVLWKLMLMSSPRVTVQSSLNVLLSLNCRSIMTFSTFLTVHD